MKKFCWEKREYSPGFISINFHGHQSRSSGTSFAADWVYSGTCTGSVPETRAMSSQNTARRWLGPESFHSFSKNATAFCNQDPWQGPVFLVWGCVCVCVCVCVFPFLLLLRLFVTVITCSLPLGVYENFLSVQNENNGSKITSKTKE